MKKSLMSLLFLIVLVNFVSSAININSSYYDYTEDDAINVLGLVVSILVAIFILIIMIVLIRSIWKSRVYKKAYKPHVKSYR